MCKGNVAIVDTLTTINLDDPTGPLSGRNPNDRKRKDQSQCINELLCELNQVFCKYQTHSIAYRIDLRPIEIALLLGLSLSDSCVSSGAMLGSIPNTDTPAFGVSKKTSGK